MRVPFQRAWRMAAGAAAVLAASMGGAQAGVTTFNLSPSSFDGSWRATADNGLFQFWRTGTFNETDGVAATVPYGNSVTTGLNNANMMWYCGATGDLCPAGGPGDLRGDAGLGPPEAYFARGVVIKPGAAATGTIAILADDFFHLWVNGNSVVDGVLDEQNTLHVVDISPYLKEGLNVLAIRALDGYLEAGQTTTCAQRAAGDPGGGWGLVNTLRGPFCRGNRELEWVNVSGSITQVPEPATWALVGVAGVWAGCLGRPRRRKATAAVAASA